MNAAPVARKGSPIAQVVRIGLVVVAAGWLSACSCCKTAEAGTPTRTQTASSAKTPALLHDGVALVGMSAQVK